MSEPAWDRIVQVAVEPASSEDVGRCPWTAVQELIGASDRQVYLGAVEIKRHCTCAVAKIPHEQRARIVSGLCELAQVQHVSGPVVHMRGRDHGHTMLDGFAELVARDAAKLYTPFLRYRLCDVQVGREVLLIGKDRSTAVQTERRVQGFVEVDGRRVAQHHLRWARAEQAPDLVAHSYGSVGPTGVVPTRDQTVSPLAHRLGKAIPRLARHGAKRVSVKVSQSRRQIELLSDGCQRIFDVEPQELFPAVQPHERSTASRSRSEAAANGPQVGERRLEERST